MPDAIKKTANSGQMYLISVVVIFFILVQSILFFIITYKRAIKIGIEKASIKRVVRSSILFSILPSIAILLGVIALAPKLGVPIPWMRLSVIGALYYENLAADTAFKGLGAKAATTGEILSTVAFFMTITIIWGVTMCLFFMKQINKSVTKARGKNPALGKILFQSVFISLALSYLALGLVSVIGYKLKDGETKTVLPLVSFLGALVSGKILSVLQKKVPKLKWLEDFIVPLGMFTGIACAVITRHCGVI